MDIEEELKPLFAFRISEGDAAAVKEVFSALGKGDEDAAKAAIAKITDPSARKFAEWKRLRSASGHFKEAMAFGAANPLFPQPPQDSGNEKALFLSSAPAADVLKFYSNRNPLTGAGKASFGGALIETGERERGVSLIKLAWSRYPLDPAVEERILSRFGNVLDQSDHDKRKLWLALRALPQDVAEKKEPARGLRAIARLRGKHKPGKITKAKNHRSSKKRRARRHSADLSTGTALKANASTNAQSLPAASIATAVALKPKNVQPAKDKNSAKEDVENSSKETAQTKAAEDAVKLSKEVQANPSALLAKLKSLRQQGEDGELWSILRSVKPAGADFADPERWWDLRRSEVRRALNEGHPETAYSIAKAHGPLDEENQSEAEFLAGWISLRFLKNPEQAQVHFMAARQAKGIIRDEARSAYWLARTKLELGDKAAAADLFKEASARFYTYYGALAGQALKGGGQCEFRPPVQPTKEEIAAFVNDDAIKAVMIIKQLDLQPLLVNYLFDLARRIQDPSQMTLLMELTERVAPPNVAVRTAKIALLRGFVVDAYAFPALLPKFDPAGGNAKIELSLLNALTRQESEFYSATISRAGARGLMQLLPQTARIVASTNKIKYEAGKLISDPSYNVTLGSAFLASLISGYDGSYVLSLAAYNAGPGRVSKWVKEFGDPRAKSMDPVDWIERIPFTETRIYVQRILEGTQLYRCRFRKQQGPHSNCAGLASGTAGQSARSRRY